MSIINRARSVLFESWGAFIPVIKGLYLNKQIAAPSIHSIFLGSSLRYLERFDKILSEEERNTEKPYKIFRKTTGINRFPSTLINCLIAEDLFSKKNPEKRYSLFLHGYPAVLYLAIQMATALKKIQMPEAFSEDRPFMVLRAPISLSHREAIKNIVEALDDENRMQPLDHLLHIRKLVLSMSYATFSNFNRGESAISCAIENFRAHPSRDFAEQTSLTMVYETLKAYGFSEERIEEIISSEKFGYLVNAYKAFPTGNFLAIAIERKLLSKFIYDSKVYGIPTEDAPEDVIDGTAGLDRLKEGHQARLIISEETLHPQSGLIIFDPNDPEEVAAVSKDIDITHPGTVKTFDKLISVKHRRGERSDLTRRSELNKVTKNYVQQIAQEASLFSESVYAHISRK